MHVDKNRDYIARETRRPGLDRPTLDPVRQTVPSVSHRRSDASSHSRLKDYERLREKPIKKDDIGLLARSLSLSLFRSGFSAQCTFKGQNTSVSAMFIIQEEKLSETVEVLSLLWRCC